MFNKIFGVLVAIYKYENEHLYEYDQLAKLDDEILNDPWCNCGKEE